MKKIILILAIIALLIIVGVVIFFIYLKAPARPTNVNQPVAVAKEKIIGNFSLFLNELINVQKVQPVALTPILEYLSFCEFKNNNISFDQQCIKTNETYYGVKNSSADCTIKDGDFAEIDFIKKGEQDNFLKICQEYISALNTYYNNNSQEKTSLNAQRFYQFYNDCNLLWDNKLYGDNEYCDAGDNCYAILLPEDQNCPNKIKIDTVSLDSIKTVQCQTQVGFRRASQKSDCLNIKNLMARLFCLDAFDNNLCSEVTASVENLKLQDFVTKYQLQTAQ
ncbi:MAG: hypothetical protein WC460_04925 [Patescibacteria group bacterium]